MGKNRNTKKPFGGAISRFVEKQAPKAIRQLLASAGKHDILDATYPYATRMSGDDYDDAHQACQLELVKAMAWLRKEKQRVVVIFEGRDAAGKGGTIQAVTENLNPRNTRIVALGPPSDVERGQWYFQRYISHLPTGGELTLFDRSWYNRAIVEHVFGWCSQEERERFFTELPSFESMLTGDGMVFIKIFLAIGRAEQLRQFLQREEDPLKQWKLSQTDIDGLERWDDYTKAIDETFERSHTKNARWTVVLSEDKRRARIAAMQVILEALDYPHKARLRPDPAICGGPALLNSSPRRLRAG